MPRGTSHVLEGLLVADRRGGLILRTDGGGTWRLDAADEARLLIDRRVRVAGVRSGFDLLDATRVEPIPD